VVGCRGWPKGIEGLYRVQRCPGELLPAPCFHATAARVCRTRLQVVAQCQRRHKKKAPCLGPMGQRKHCMDGWQAVKPWWSPLKFGIPQCQPSDQNHLIDSSVDYRAIALMSHPDWPFFYCASRLISY